MIISLFKKLFCKKSSQISFDSKSKKYLVDWIQTYMNLNRGSPYVNIDETCHFNEFSKIAKKNWHKILYSAFSHDLMKDEDIRIEQQISSDIFNYFYKGLFHEIRNISYNIIKSNISIEELVTYQNDIERLHGYLVIEHPKRFKFLGNVDKFGSKIIMNELKIVFNKVLEKKLRNTQDLKKGGSI